MNREQINNLIDSIQNDEHNLKNPDNFNYYVKNIDGYRFTDKDLARR